MTASQEKGPSAGTTTKPLEKLPRIPQGAKVQKRPLLRRQHPASSKTPVIYISSKTPFMSAVKRVQKHLDKSVRNATSAAPRNASLHSRVEALGRGGEAAGGDTFVTVTGTGKAIEKTLSLASWFEQKGDCVVRVKTGTVGAVDDVLAQNEDAEDESRVRRLSSLEVVVSLK